MVVAALASAFVLTVAPPAKPGDWHQVGAAATSKTGKQAHFVRTATMPGALAVVASSSSARPIRLTWFAYCSRESADGMEGQQQGTAVGVRHVSAYPEVMAGATTCYVVVTMRVVAGKVAAAVFAG